MYAKNHNNMHGFRIKIWFYHFGILLCNFTDKEMKA